MVLPQAIIEPPRTQKPLSKKKQYGIGDVNVSDSTDRDKFTIETNNYKNADMLKFMNDDEEED